MSAAAKPIPSDKTVRYDRQLRLWGETGQRALEGALVCLINATATGTEILKNLILPGVGGFRIVDKEKVSQADVDNNFFVTASDVGSSRAEVACRLLKLHNPDVQADFLEADVVDILENEPNYFASFTLVVAVSLNESEILNLSKVLWRLKLPLLISHCIGFMAYLRIVTEETAIIEAHPDNALEDLRLDRPFAALQQFCDQFDLTKMNKKEHSHTPWLIIIYKYLEIWKEQHGGEAPKNYSEKKEFKKLISSGVFVNDDGLPEHEDNFEEALNAVNSALVPTKIPNTTREIFDDPSCSQLSSQSSTFWIVARAVRDYIESSEENTGGCGCLPLRGTIPDMTSDTERYVKLQNVYRTQAEKDILNVFNKVNQLLTQLGRVDPSDAISIDQVRLFCKNAAFLRCIRTSSIEEELASDNSRLSELATLIEDLNGDRVFYILYRAILKFRALYNFYPGQVDLESDITKFKTCISDLLRQWSIQVTVRDDYIQEVCRWGGAEFHSIAAFIGGVGAQEAIKLITRQFVPINNTFIYNGVQHSSVTLTM